MAPQTVAHPTSLGEDSLVSDWEFVDRVDETGDPLDPARGALLGVMLCAPFWFGVLWALL